MKKNKELRRYYRKQKLVGLVLIVLSIFTILLGDGDATFAVLTIPLGTYLIVTKNLVLEDDYKEKVEREARS